MVFVSLPKYFKLIEEVVFASYLSSILSRNPLLLIELLLIKSTALVTSILIS